MAKYITDLHAHSTYSHDGREELASMLKTALQKGLLFFGVSEHIDYDVYTLKGDNYIDEEAYFHGGRHLQEDYAGCMNVLIGAEYGYIDNEKVQKMYQETYAKYHPDFVINSVHCVDGEDYYFGKIFLNADGSARKKAEVYREYLGLIRRSLDAPYPYDIVGHIGYITRYAPYENRSLSLEDFGEEIDDILKTIIAKDKILEVNSSTKGRGLSVTDESILRRYFQLGGRKVSFGADAHESTRIAENHAAVMAMLKEIGFTYVTVPDRGEHIKIEI